MDYKVGCFVDSKAGRDKGRRLVVYQKLDDEYCLVVDGKRRPLLNPKRKKCKHLKFLNFKSVEFSTDAQLRKDIARTMHKEDE